MIQNAFTGNIAIDIYGDRDALVWQQWSEKWSVEYTIKLPYSHLIISYLYLPHKNNLSEVYDKKN